MKATRLIAVLVAFAAIAMVATDASAYYHPRMGRFLSRDPGARGGGPARVGSAGPAVRGGFAHRDPTGSNQYADGMNLYQYVKSSPINALDPQGTVVVVIAGWEQWGTTMEPIRVAVRNELKRRLAKYDDNRETLVKSWIVQKQDAAQYAASLRVHYQQFLARKRGDICRLEQFVVVGHNSGATAIYEEANAGTFRQVGGNGTIPIYPAYLGLVDMWVPLAEDHVMEGLPPLTYAQHFKQLITPPIRGINNHNILWVNHFNILRNDTVLRSIAHNAGAAYESAVVINRSFPGVPQKWKTDRDKNQW